MTNPYQTPAARLEGQPQKSKTRWKIFFWIMLGLEAISVVLIFFDDTFTLIDLTIELVVYTAILCGLFGYAFNRRFLRQAFWRSVLPVAFIYDAYYLFIDEPWSFESAAQMYVTLGFVAVAVLPLMYFQYLALYRYAFKAPEIWRSGE